MATLLEIQGVTTDPGWGEFAQKVEGAVVIKASAIVAEVAALEYQERTDSQAYAVDDYIWQGDNLYKCVGAGTTAASAPAAFPAVANGTVLDGGVKWEFFRSLEDGLLAWARTAIDRPAIAAHTLVRHLIGVNSSLTINQMLTASDNAIQTNVDAAVDALYSAIAVNDNLPQ